MEFLAWHYSFGVNYYIESWMRQFKWIRHYFSLPLLLRTLFAPWKRMIMFDNKPGFDLNRFFQTLTFNMVSRVVGAGVRITLFFVGIVLLVVTFFAGVFGFIFWVLIPFFSWPVYTKYNKRPDIVMRDLMFKVKTTRDNPLQVLFNSEPGLFFLNHLGLSYDSLSSAITSDKLDLNNLAAKNFSDVVNWFLEKGSFEDERLRKLGLVKEDLITVAKMWDKKKEDESFLGSDELGRPSIGLEVLFGYTPTLNQYSTDLSAPQSFSHRLIGREEIVNRMYRELSVDRSIVLTGDPGVGKKTVVLEFANRAATGKFGSKMAYKRVLEFDYNFILSESMDINKKKTQLTQILDEAAYAGNIVLMIRDLHRLIHSDVEGFDFTDTFEAAMGRGELKIIAVATNVEYERFIAPNSRLRKYFERIEVTPPSKEQAYEILVEWAKTLEIKKNLIIEITALRKILNESDRYITDTPFPEKALELLDAVVTFVEESKKQVVEADDVNAVFAEKTGISLARLTSEEKTKLGDLENIIHENLVDQELAVKQIAQSLRAKTLGVSENKRPIGSFLFLGPTGVGKTETAKVLAKVYYGSEEQILRFDMAEYAGKEGFERLIGSQGRNTPGALTTAIKNKPASLLLLDEFEKASRDIFNLFLTVLDEGYITDAFGKRVGAGNLFIIGTSNAAAEYIRKLVGSGIRGEELQKSVVNFVLENAIFTPELLNRFDGVIVYEPLEGPELKKVAKLILDKYAKNLKNKGIILNVTDSLIEKLATDGYDPAFGARPMRRIVDLVISDLIGKEMISGNVADGDSIDIIPGSGKEEYKVVKKTG